MAKAVAEGKVVLHGFLLSTGSTRVRELDPETGQFIPMRPITLEKGPNRIR